MSGLSSTLALFKAAIAGEDAARMTIDEAHLHERSGRGFPAKVILEPTTARRDDAPVTVRGIDFGMGTTVVLSAHAVELDDVRAGRFVQPAPARLFDGHKSPHTLSVQHCTLDAIETQGVENIRALHNRGSMELTAKGVNDLYLEDNVDQTGLRINLVEGLQVVIAGPNRLRNNEKLDFMPVNLDGRRETMISDGTRFCFHKMNADKQGMRRLIEGRIDLRQSMIRDAYEGGQANAADLDARETPHIAEYQSFIATLDAYEGKTQTVESVFAARSPRPQGR